jgi:hypothetical protein
MQDSNWYIGFANAADPLSYRQKPIKSKTSEWYGTNINYR